MYQQRRAFRQLNLLISLRGLILAARNDGYVDEKPAERGRSVADERIHQELSEIATHRVRRRRVRRAEIDEKYSCAHFGTHASGVLLLSVRTPLACCYSRYARLWRAAIHCRV